MNQPANATTLLRTSQTTPSVEQLRRPLAPRALLVYAFGVFCALWLAACGGDSNNQIAADGAGGPASDPQPDTSGDGSSDTPGDPADPVADAPQAPPPAPVDLEPAPDAAVGATTIARLSDVQRITFADTAATDPAGQSPTPIVLLHDFGASSIQWAALTPLLNVVHRTIAPDLRGHGNSSAVSDYSLAAMSADVLAVLDSLGIDRAHLIGSGGGGLIAQHLALNHPQRVARLVLSGTDSTAGDNTAYQDLAARAAGFGDGAPDDEFLSQWNQAGPQTDPSTLATLQTVQRRTPAGVWNNALQTFTSSDLTSRLGTVSAATMLLTGEHDTLMGARSQQRLAAGMGHEVGVVVPQAGRYPAVERPAQTDTLIRKFLSPRGTLHASALLGERSQAEFRAVGDSSFLEGIILREITGIPDCNVRFHQIEYQTTGAAGESTNAGAAVLAPYGDNPLCNGPRPIVLYAHGTATDKNYSALANAEVNIIAATIFAARGYIVVAPDYTGYNGSWLDYHPYLNASAQADDMVDALRAAGTMLHAQSNVSPDKLFITGYSQGGHVAMATHRQIELNYADEFTVSGSLPMSGPYELEYTMDEVLGGRVNVGASQIFPFLADGFQRAFSNIYADPSAIYNAPYDQTAIGIFPGSVSAGDSVRQNLLPSRLIASQGEPHLIPQDYVNDYLTNPDNGLRQALQRNRLLDDWTPVAPMQLCGGGRDRVVYFSNAVRVQSHYGDQGVWVRLWNFDNKNTFPNGSRNSLYRKFRSLFLFGNDENYHVTLAPFCAAIARGFFDQHR